MQFMRLKLIPAKMFFANLFFGRHEQFATKTMNKTETRDYAYFYTGIRRLKEQLKELL